MKRLVQVNHINYRLEIIQTVNIDIGRFALVKLNNDGLRAIFSLSDMKIVQVIFNQSTDTENFIKWCREYYRRSL